MPTKTPAINISKHRGEWLALHPKTRRIVGHNRSLRLAISAAQKRGIDEPLMYPVRKSTAYTIGII